MDRIVKIVKYKQNNVYNYIQKCVAYYSSTTNYQSFSTTINKTNLSASSSLRPQNSLYNFYTIVKPKNYSTNNDNISKLESFDEFRAREEKKESEFSKQHTQAPSTEGPSTTNAEDDQLKLTKTSILDAALNHVDNLGWTRKAIARGAEDVNFPSTSHGLFPKGGIELIQHFYTKCNQKLVDQLKYDTENVDKVLNPSEFATKAIKMRLSMLEPYVKTWPQALGIMTLPPNVPTSLANLLTLVDDICYYAGDRSVDFNWYTRRIGLASIYKATEIYILQDTSPNFEKTWIFLERRMEEAAVVHGFLVKSEDATQHLQQAVGSVFSTARNILGLNFDRR